MIVDLVRCVRMDLTSGSYDWDDGGTVERVRVEREEKAGFGLPSCMVGGRVGGDVEVLRRDDGDASASVIWHVWSLTLPPSRG